MFAHHRRASNSHPDAPCFKQVEPYQDEVGDAAAKLSACYELAALRVVDLHSFQAC